MGGLLLALVGPTAAGKSRMAVEVALSLGAEGHRVEILSCDSMGVYRGLDIAADKPPPEDRARVPHHLLDVADPAETFTAVRFRQLARDAIARVRAGGGVPLLVGGSGLWFRAVVDDLEFAPSDPAVRARLQARPPEELRERLRAADPDLAARLHPRNLRRLVRAVEVMELTGRPPSERWRSWGQRGGPFRLVAVGLTWDRPELYRRAAERVRREVAAGLVEEVRRAARRGLGATARQALGVKEVLEHLEGRLTLQQAIELDVRRTKDFIRRQLAWFGSDPRVEWVNASALGWEGARERILARFREALGAAGPRGGTPPEPVG